ncbi:MAG: hypothetical protein EAX95_16170, partial [Candidatus Thorarchaeota archaeon]|nr:hypothetical protein [Candidatus Thorarchaeota archaeon]
NGIYELTLDMTGLIAQDYPFTVQAEKQFYQTATILISVTPGASTFTLQLARTTVYAQWGELAEIRIDVRESYYLSLIPGANVTLFWNAVYYDFTDLNNGTYVLFLDTSNNNFGIYNPQISVSREYYQTRQTSLTLVVTKAPGQVVSEQTSYDVVINTAHEITIYLNDSLNSGPVVATSISLEWNNTIYPIAGNGTPGFYTFTIDVTGFDIGPYQAIISVAALNHQFLDYILDINVVPIPTLISHIPAEPAIFLIRGDQLIILVHYNDSYYGGFILGANVSYTIAGLTGSFIPEANGTYSAVIGTSSLAAQTFFLRIEGSRTGYSTATRRIPVTLLPVPTILLADKTFDSGHHNEIVEFSFYYNDTHNNQPITGALGLVSWEGGSFTAEEIGGGYYLAAIVLTPTSPRPYDISVTFSRQDYETASIIIRVQIEATPATVTAPASVSIPVNDTTVDHFVYLTVKSDLDNSTLTGFIGIAYWTTIGEVELSVNETSGDYYFQIDPFLPLGSYTVVVSFNTAIYDIDQTTIEVIVRPIATSLTVIAPSTSQIDSFPGDSILVSLLYFDLDHELGIDGANIQVSVSGGNVTYLEQFTQVNQGVYEMTFVVNTQQTFYITITLSKDQHMTGEAVITVRSDISGAQVLARNMALIGGFAFIFLAAFIVLYVRVYSVPRMIRILNKMIKAIAGGKIPKAPQVASRQESILVIVNEDLKSTGIQKTPDEVVEVPIIAVVPEVNELLERLAEITGLGDVELDAFRHDLSRMKASERPGFIREVIEQEEARRADALAKVKPEEAKEPKRESLEEMPSELEELRMKLKRKGMSNDEIDIIIDQAKSLSPADLEALLDSLGIKL